MNDKALALQGQTEMDVMSLGQMLAKSGYFTDVREASQAVVKVLAGRELGFGPIASMTGIYLVKNRVTLSANLMAAAIKRSGHYNYRVLKLDDQECSIQFMDGKDVIGVSTFTAQDAKRAGLSGGNWTNYPRNMLFARAMSNGAKWYCPDVFGGPVYTPDELGERVDQDGEIVDVTPTQPVAVLEPRSTSHATTDTPTATERPTDVVVPPQAIVAHEEHATTASASQIQQLGILVGKLYPDNASMADFRARLQSRYGVTSRKDLTTEQAAELIGILRDKESRLATVAA